MSAPRSKPSPAAPREPPSPLQSLSEWASLVHLKAPTGAPPKALKRITRETYDAMAPKPAPAALSKRAQKAHIQTLEALHASRDVPLKIAPQSQDKRTADNRDSPAEYLKANPDKALGEFAYRYRPDDKRPSDPQGRSGRLTVNMNPKRSRSVSMALGTVLSDPVANPNLRALKVMGPANIGQRVDDAVLYLRGHDERGGKVVASNLRKELQGTPDALLDHGPPGMLRVARGISYAETVPGDSTSHGNARGKIVAAAVQDYRSLGGAMRHHVSYRAFRSGYNPELPSHAIAPARMQLMADIPGAAARHKQRREQGKEEPPQLPPDAAKARQALLKAIPAAADRHRQRADQRQPPTLGPQAAKARQGLLKEIETFSAKRQAAKVPPPVRNVPSELRAAVEKRRSGAHF